VYTEEGEQRGEYGQFFEEEDKSAQVTENIAFAPSKDAFDRRGSRESSIKSYELEVDVISLLKKDKIVRPLRNFA
jgi:hypothetical protein